MVEDGAWAVSDLMGGRTWREVEMGGTATTSYERDDLDSFVIDVGGETKTSRDHYLRTVAVTTAAGVKTTDTVVQDWTETYMGGAVASKDGTTTMTVHRTGASLYDHQHTELEWTGPVGDRWTRRTFDQDKWTKTATQKSVLHSSVNHDRTFTSNTGTLSSEEKRHDWTNSIYGNPPAFDKLKAVAPSFTHESKQYKPDGTLDSHTQEEGNRSTVYAGGVPYVDEADYERKQDGAVEATFTRNTQRTPGGDSRSFHGKVSDGGPPPVNAELKIVWKTPGGELDSVEIDGAAAALPLSEANAAAATTNYETLQEMEAAYFGAASMWGYPMFEPGGDPTP